MLIVMEIILSNDYTGGDAIGVAAGGDSYLHFKIKRKC
jgi:hypothetical protein